MTLYSRKSLTGPEIIMSKSVSGQQQRSKCIIPVVLNTLRTVTVFIMPAERSLSAISGKTTVAAHRPRNGRAE